MMSRPVLAAALALSFTLAPATPARALDLHRHWDDRCAGCHGDAAEFARRTLRLENGQLVGRHHGRDLPVFLRQHYLTDELVAPVTAMLRAQLGTTPLFKPRCGGCHGTAAEFARQSLAWRDGVLVGRAEGRPVVDTLRRHGKLAAADQAAMLRTLQRVLREVGGGDAPPPVPPAASPAR